MYGWTIFTKRTAKEAGSMARGGGWGWQVQVPQTQVLTELKRGPETPADAPQGLNDVKPAGLAPGLYV